MGDTPQLGKKTAKSVLATALLWGVVMVVLCAFLFITLRNGVTVKQAMIPILLGAGCVIAAIFIREPLFGVYILVAAMPVLAADFLSSRLINIAGVKLDILLCMGVFACLLFGHVRGSMGSTEKKFSVLILLVFFVAYMIWVPLVFPPY